MKLAGRLLDRVNTLLATAAGADNDHRRSCNCINDHPSCLFLFDNEL